MATRRRSEEEEATAYPEEEEEKRNVGIFSKKYWENVGSTFYEKCWFNFLFEKCCFNFFVEKCCNICWKNVAPTFPKKMLTDKCWQQSRKMLAKNCWQQSQKMLTKKILATFMKNVEKL
jgi:hypothetical protein